MEVIPIRAGSSSEEKQGEALDGGVQLTWVARIYGLIVLTFLNMMNFIQQYVLVGTIYDMAAELEFGDTACIVKNATAIRDYLVERSMEGSLFCAQEGRCNTNSTTYFPAGCYTVYTGMGTAYDVLAGPIYLIIQGIATVPLLGLAQAVHMRQTVSLALLTMLWSLCTLATSLVNEYWTVALLRFLFGIFSGPFFPLSVSYIAMTFPLERQTLAIGVTHYGSISGLGISYLFVDASNAIGWRWCYALTALAGIAFGVAAYFMKEGDPRLQMKLRLTRAELQASLLRTPWRILVPVLVGNTMRTGGIIVVSFNITNHLETYYPDLDVNILTWITLVVALPSCVLGGYAGDCLRPYYAIRGRVWLCLFLLAGMASCVPFIFQTGSPTVFILFAIVLFMVDWFYAVVLAAIADLTPEDSRTMVFGVTYFIAFSLGGAVNLLVTPMTDALANSKEALSLLTGTLLLFGVAVMLAAAVQVQIHEQRGTAPWANGVSPPASETTQLLTSPVEGEIDHEPSRHSLR